jgi:glycosyltransferase involved in cell wall biosynthesis
MTQADVCLILEGTYPYVQGGVSSWTHDLISRQSHLTFHILCILPKDASTELKYTLPSNVVGVTNIVLQDLPEGRSVAQSTTDHILQQLEEPLTAITNGAGIEAFEEVYRILKPYHHLGADALMNSRSAWETITRMYQRDYDESSFLDYFWSWRALVGGMITVLLADLPPARAYHTLCTGYAGLMAARAKLETGRPVILTEHGIYTSERLIEIASADWLEETASKALTIDETRRNLRDFWSDSFSSYARICYEAVDNIITLYEGNQRIQKQEGAPVNKLAIVPNGVDVERFSSVTMAAHDNPTVALIGRVVPIKDVKTYLRAVALLSEQLPDVRALVIGSAEEDPEYFTECQQMVTYLGLEDVVKFTGQVDIRNYLGSIDVVVLSSISEAMPLVILEAGAVGIPVVATDVGACRELIEGNTRESPALGEGGVVTPLSNPLAIAEGCYALLTDFDRYQRASAALKARVRKYYDKSSEYEAYRKIYAQATQQATQAAA